MSDGEANGEAMAGENKPARESGVSGDRGGDGGVGTDDRSEPLLRPRTMACRSQGTSAGASISLRVNESVRAERAGQR